jgi:hypothetical protein
MTEPSKAAGEAVPATIQIDPFVALAEVEAKARADNEFYRNRVLLLAQKLHIATGELERLREQVEALTDKE